MTTTSNARMLRFHLFSSVCGAIGVLWVVWREPRTWSYALAFLVCAIALLMMLRGLIYIVRSKCHFLLADIAQTPHYDLLPCLIGLPVVVGWWLLAREEPIMGTAHLFPYVLELSAVLILSSLSLRSFVQWPVGESIVQRWCDGIHRWGCYVCFLIFVATIMAQLRTADVPSTSSPPESRLVSASTSIGATCSSKDLDDEDDEASCPPQPAVAEVNPSASQVHAESTSAFFSFWVWLTQLPAHTLDLLANLLADKTFPFHLSSATMGMVSLIKLMGRFYLLYIGKRTSSATQTLAPSDTQVSDVVSERTEVNTAIDAETNTPQEQAHDELKQTIEAITNFISEVSTTEVSSTNATLSGEVANEVAHEAIELSSAILENHVNETGPDLNTSIAAISPSFTVENEQTLVRLQSILNQSGALSQALAQHKGVMQDLLALTASKAK